MLQDILFFSHYALLLLFGIFFSAAFAGIQPTKKNFSIYTIFTCFCATIQIVLYSFLKETVIWELYPLLTHLPLVFLLRFYHKKRLSTALVSVTTAYLCCQPANFLGIFVFNFTRNSSVEYFTRILVICITGIILFRFAVSYLAQLYNRNIHILRILGILPIGYYCYDYAFGIFADFWRSDPIVAQQILPLLLVFIYVLFCIAYYREYEMRQVAEQKEQIILTESQQQEKEIDAIKRSAQEIRLIRHDMRHLLDSISFCLDINDTEKARELISGFISHIDATIVARYCKNDTLNYVLSSYVAKCEAHNINLTLDVQIDDIHIDEIIFCSILTNAFDNAFNAQMELPKEKRRIKLMIVNTDGRILISVKNTFFKKPVIVDGLPVTKRKGHGYGTQSIRYLTEKIGGNYQFYVQDDLFIVRLVL